jgi:hypothetical protein
MQAKSRRASDPDHATWRKPLPKFNVRLVRGTTESTTVTVEADTEKEALTIGENEAYNNPNGYLWEVSGDHEDHEAEEAEMIEDEPLRAFEVTLTRTETYLQRASIWVKAQDDQQAVRFAIADTVIKDLVWENTDGDPNVSAAYIESDDHVVEGGDAIKTRFDDVAGNVGEQVTVFMNHPLPIGFKILAIDGECDRDGEDNERSTGSNAVGKVITAHNYGSPQGWSYGVAFEPSGVWVNIDQLDSIDDPKKYLPAT